MRKRSAGLRVVVRPDTGALTIVGTVAGRRIRESAKTADYRLAVEKAATLEAELFHTAWYGERRGTRKFAQAVDLYLDSAPRTKGTQQRLTRLLLALGDVTLGEIDRRRSIAWPSGCSTRTPHRGR